MAEGVHETQMVNLEGEWYELEATKNQFKVTRLHEDTDELLYTIEFDEYTKQFMVRDNRLEN